MRDREKKKEVQKGRIEPDIYFWFWTEMSNFDLFQRLELYLLLLLL